MLFKKSEPRRWHPCLVIAVGALAVVGAVTVTNAAKQMVEGIKSKMKSMWQKSPECQDDLMQCE